MRGAAAVLLGTVLAACGATAQSGPEGAADALGSATRPNDRLLVASPAGLSVVDVATGKVDRQLPPGILTPDRSAYWTVEPGDTTVARKLDIATGDEVDRIALPGRFDLPRQYGPLADALSANGRYLVLVGANGGSSFVVLDTTKGNEKARASMTGSFTFDAIDEYGTSLYLLEHPDPTATRYNVRLFDLSEGTLISKAVVDAKSPAPSAADLAKGTMGGIYHASAVAGLWHFGLYTSATRGPVVHSLNMVSRYAFCLFTLSDAATHAAAWSIVPAPNGDRVFAVNPANGSFASIMADSLQTAKRTFAVAATANAVRGGAAITADGTRLYATGGQGILVVDAHTLSMKAQYLADQQFASVMVSPDGTRLYALAVDGAISRIEPGTGRDLGVVARLPDAVSILEVR